MTVFIISKSKISSIYIIFVVSDFSLTALYNSNDTNSYLHSLYEDINDGDSEGGGESGGVGMIFLTESLQCHDQCILFTWYLLNDTVPQKPSILSC
jgi:hypothetical protein